jgi:exonuclease III
MICITWNVGGLADSKKRELVWQQIKGKTSELTKVKVLWTLQETHSTEKDYKNCITSLGPSWNVVCSHGTSTKAGIWWLSNQLKLDVLGKDKDGRWITIETSDNDFKQVFTSIYAPANDPTTRKYWFKKFDWKQQEDWGAIIGGDWNTVTEPDGKHSTRREWTDKVDSKLLREMLSKHQLVDGWKLKGKLNDSNDPGHTFIHRSNSTSSRIDKWMVPGSKISLIKKLEVNRMTVESDHQPLLLELDTLQFDYGPGLWKLNNSLLLDSDVCGSN